MEGEEEARQAAARERSYNRGVSEFQKHSVICRLSQGGAFNEVESD